MLDATPGGLAAESAWSYRLAFTEETRVQFFNPKSPLYPVRAYLGLNRASQFAQVQLDLNLHPLPWLKIRGSAAETYQYNSRHTALLRPRELWVGLSLSPHLDFYAGRRILKWGTGYAFTPTGFVDPQRDPSDPQDRLRLNQGKDLAGLDYTRGKHTAGLVFSAPNLVRKGTLGGDGAQLAARYGLLLRGLDVGIVGSWESHRRERAGVNATYVVGSRLELHVEWSLQRGSDRNYPLAMQEEDPRRSYPASPMAPLKLSHGALVHSMLGGANVTFGSGWNLVGELFHSGSGLSGREWERYLRFINYNEALSGSSPAAVQNLLGTAAFGTGIGNRRDYGFLRAAKDDVWRHLSVEVSAVFGFDRGLAATAEVATSLGRSLSGYVRASWICAAAGSAFRQIPVSGGISFGLRAAY